MADLLAGHVVWSVGDFGREDAGGVGAEDGCCGGGGGEVEDAGLVVVDGFEGFEGCEVAAVFSRS